MKKTNTVYPQSYISASKPIPGECLPKMQKLLECLGINESPENIVGGRVSVNSNFGILDNCDLRKATYCRFTFTCSGSQLLDIAKAVMQTFNQGGHNYPEVSATFRQDDETWVTINF